MNLRPFELGLIVLFIILIAGSLLFMSVYKPGSDNDGLPQVGTVTIWGTLPQAGMDQVLRSMAEVNDSYNGVSYREISSNNFSNELVNALADQIGPDLLLISHERLVELRRRLQVISYESFPLRDFRSLYLDGAAVFALQDGVYAYPIAVDPLMMYWNRDILSNDNLLAPPATWEALVNSYTPTLIRREADRSITRSVVAMGEYSNVRNSFGIISALLIQSGSALVTEQNNEYLIQLDSTLQGTERPFQSVTDFYTRFSRPSNALYSWNRSFAQDRDRFVSEDLALYFGYGSEGHELERLNPNLNFDIAELPQGGATTVRRTYGQFYGLAVLRSSDNLPGAAIVLRDLAGAQLSKRIADAYNLVPALRSLVSAGSNDTYGRLSYTSASITYGWLNPNLAGTKNVFDTMVRDINENRNDINGAVSDAEDRLELEYN